MGFFFYVLAVVLVALVGVGLHFFMRSRVSHESISSPALTKTEWVAGVLIASLVVVPAVSFFGAKIARAQAATYTEYWSGLEKSADMERVVCEKDGRCRHTYDCDAYTVMVTKTRQVPYTTTEPDGNGGVRTVTKYETETYQEPETRYHSCPYVTHEYSYTVEDTLGETYDFGSHLFPENPSSHRWTGSGSNDPRWGFGRPSLPKVKSGVPQEWLTVKARLEAGEPGGTTKQHKYKNYILASHEDIFEKSSNAIEDYRKENLLPKVADKIYSHYRADKVYFVGSKPTDASEWQTALQRLNGYLGSERQGDLHVVVVDSSLAPDADRYSQALEAYWQSEALGKNSLSKNGVGLVLGVSGSEISWSRGFTGMPMGNESLLMELRSLAGETASPALLDPKTGPVANLLLAEDAGYTRVEMKNYEYLYASVDIGTGARIGILAVGIVLSLLVWLIFFAVDLRFRPIEQLRLRFRSEDDVDTASTSGV